MRRFVAFTIASCFVLAIGPAAALARHHHPRHHHHHAKRMERFGTLGNSSTTTGSPTTGSPTTTPSTVGTITAFSNGMLTITLSNNSTVSGAVTQDTEVECSSSSTMGDDLATDDNPGGGTQGGDDNSQGSGNTGQNGGGDQGDQGDQGDDNGGQGQSSCSLALNATVVGAELEITSAGAVWTKIELG